MRHRKEGKKFHRKTGPRRSFLRNLANDLVRTGKIETTQTRAKALRPLVERWVTIAKKQNLVARRLLLRRAQNERAVEKLLREWSGRYASRAGGYLRITKLTKSRKRDSAPLARIEFV